MELTNKNYYSIEANNAYWSASLIKSFLECPAKAIAELNGEYTRPVSTALLVGSYVDAYFDGEDAFEAFTETHPEIFKKDGSLKADYVNADAMIARAKADPVFMQYLAGVRQKIFTGTIFGFPFKAKFDFYIPGERIVDLKTARDLKPVYKPGEGMLTFADAWNYPLQMAIYQKLEGNNLPCYLAVVTKEDPPALDLIQIPQAKLDAELEYLKMILPKFDAMRQGVLEPDRCEDCAYCRATKKIAEPRILTEWEEE